MNQTLLTRLFRTIKGDANEPLLKVAFSIIEDTKKKGHIKLAQKLSDILQANNTVPQTQPIQELRPIKGQVIKIPVDRRYRLPLATHIEYEDLRRNMVLSPTVESKIVRIEEEFLARERLIVHGLHPRKKMLFYGSSGCGKSMAAERIAWDLGLPFYKVRFDTIISSYLGESAANLQQLFKSMEDFPCALLLDEFDIIGKKRESSTKDVGEIHRILNVLLGLLEEYNGEGLLIATTNLEGSLDSALYRRFDDFVEFPKPGVVEIEALLKQAFSALRLHKNIDLKRFSEKLMGVSSAIIVKIANDAAKKSIIKCNNDILLTDLESALEENQAINR